MMVSFKRGDRVTNSGIEGTVDFVYSNGDVHVI